MMIPAMAVSIGLPFTLVLLVGCYAIIRGLMSELRPKQYFNDLMASKRAAMS